MNTLTNWFGAALLATLVIVGCFKTDIAKYACDKGSVDACNVYMLQK